MDWFLYACPHFLTKKNDQVHTHYQPIIQFLRTYEWVGYVGLNKNDKTLGNLEVLVRENRQFFYVCDILKMKILFTCGDLEKLNGTRAEDLDFSTFFLRTHPEDQPRHAIARTKTLHVSQDIFFNRTPVLIQSSNFRQLGANESYFDMLYQVYIFISEHTKPTVYMALLLTNIDRFKLGIKKSHYYLGSDSANFRYPDEELLSIGHQLSSREFQIIKLISEGMRSEEIAEKLFVSLNTAKTHRRNILRKTGMNTTHELIYDLIAKGML